MTPLTLYMRELPPSCVAFSSKEGKALFGEALVDGTMEGFFKLMEQFRRAADRMGKIMHAPAQLLPLDRAGPRTSPPTAD